MEALLLSLIPNKLTIITPSDPEQRGAQLSLVFNSDLTKVHKRIQEKGVVCDVRLPSAMRIAPAPMYNSFSDVLSFVKILQEALEQ